MARTARCAVLTTALVLVLGGCSGGGSTPSSSRTATQTGASATPTDTATSTDTALSTDTATPGATVPPAVAATARTAIAFPAALVGVWAGGQETGGRRLTFTADGRFDTERYRGTAVVHGHTMIWQVDGQSPTTVSWSLSGGVLTIGETTYLRDDQRTGGEISLVGTWIDINGSVTFTFGADGSFTLDDPAIGSVTTGSYTLRGNRLTLTSRTKQATYVLSPGTFLTVAKPSGQVLGEFTRAG